MIEKIKNLFLNKYLDVRLRFLGNVSGVQNFPEKIGEVKNILVIIPTNTENKGDYHYFKSKLYRIFDNVKVSTFERDSLRKSDCNWLGVPLEDYLRKFQDDMFDLVIDLNNEQDKICVYICALSGAPLRLNLASGRYDDIYNLRIQSSAGKSLKEQLDNILNYLITFKESASKTKQAG